MLVTMLGAQSANRRLRTGTLLRASASFSGTLLLALGAYYAVLA
jgi:hypothetical protein